MTAPELRPGWSLFILGATGTGKSTLLRNALIEEGSGAVALAPGIDEWGSYLDLAEVEGFAIRGFDAWPTVIPWLQGVYKLNQQSLRESGKLVHRIVGLDTYTGFDQLVVFHHLQRLGLSEFPKAQSPEGADFYSGLRKDMERLAAVCRACRGLGMHWIATGHTTEKDTTTSKGGMDVVEAGTKQQMPLFRGSFREEAPAAFDVVVHTDKRKVVVDGKAHLQYSLQWRSGERKAAKSRFGALSDGAYLKADWPTLQQAVEEAIERRRQEMLQRLRARKGR